jgi:hypothetical protein
MEPICQLMNPDFGRLKSAHSTDPNTEHRLIDTTHGTVPAGVHGEPLPVRDDALLQHGGCPLQPRLSVSSLRELSTPRAQVPTLRPGTSRIRIHFRSEFCVENELLMYHHLLFIWRVTYDFDVGKSISEGHWKGWDLKI